MKWYKITFKKDNLLFGTIIEGFMGDLLGFEYKKSRFRPSNIFYFKLDKETAKFLKEHFVGEYISIVKEDPSCDTMQNGLV